VAACGALSGRCRLRRYPWKDQAVTLNNPELFTFAIYINVMLLIGFIAYRSTHNLRDYILGGRRLGSVVTALSAGASDMSGWLLLGLPGSIYLGGLSAVWVAVGLLIGAWVNWVVIAGRLRAHTQHNGDALTLPDYFARRFDDHSGLLRVISALVILVFFTVYCASGIVAGARLFEDVFGMPYYVAVWAGATATITYTFVGGFLAVSWSDTLQATLMLFALILAPVMLVVSSGGLDSTVQAIALVDPGHFDLFRDCTVVGMISLLGWGLGYMGQPHILARFMAARSLRTLRPASWLAMLWMLLCLAGAVACGFFAIGYFALSPALAAEVAARPEGLFLEVVDMLFNPWVAGIMLSAVLAAVMSTLNCQLLVCCSALTEDIYRPTLGRQATPRELLWVGRAMVVLIAVAAILIALSPDNRVLSLVSYAWAGFGAAFGPVVLLSITWRGITRNGALAGMLVGSLTVMVWDRADWFGLYELVPGFVFASLAIVLVSRTGPGPSLAMRSRFAAADHDFRAER
jgi:sodium/proline symporter